MAAPKITALVEALRCYRAERIYLVGSYARGEEDELSDIDLVIIKDTAVPFLERMREVGRLVPAELGGVDVLVYSPEEFSAMLAAGNAFAEMVAEEGRLIYGAEAQG
ncbi:MAG: nucleotidyltransferase domain-containing protein [Deltaproteobacteria bacterium]|nr:MAG: nucleotidyltransferase domain-containing protein [Deltaproteobacteria bacterium]TMA53675.1 MAG: nucleotidyltransferase domain-containing protein [Deltaproteobacteria bacterium]